MTMFAILQEEKSGLRHWVRIKAPGVDIFTSAAPGAAPEEMQYADRETAERDAEIYRVQNARDVKRRRAEPATFSVLPVTLEAR